MISIHNMHRVPIQNYTIAAILHKKLSAYTFVSVHCKHNAFYRTGKRMSKFVILNNCDEKSLTNMLHLAKTHIAWLFVVRFHTLANVMLYALQSHSLYSVILLLDIMDI